MVVVGTHKPCVATFSKRGYFTLCFLPTFSDNVMFAGAKVVYVFRFLFAKYTQVVLYVWVFRLPECVVCAFFYVGFSFFGDVSVNFIFNR